MADACSRPVVLAGPTAVGKGTVADCVRRNHPEIWISVSATTRRPRPGEVDGVNYHFMSATEFDRLAAAGGLLEWAVVHGLNRYGTPREPVEARLAAGVPTLLELDLQGARQVREQLPDAHLVFLKPPSFAELIRRSRGRGTESEDEREQRLETARVELAAESEFDSVIVNHDVETACAELVDLISNSANITR